MDRGQDQGDWQECQGLKKHGDEAKLKLKFIMNDNWHINFN